MTRRYCRWFGALLLSALALCAVLWYSGSLVQTTTAWEYVRLPVLVGTRDGSGSAKRWLPVSRRMRDSVVARKGETGLREFQGSLDENQRLLRQFLNLRAGPPPLMTRANCSQIILEAAKAKITKKQSRNVTTRRTPQSEIDSKLAISRRHISIRDRLKFTTNCTQYVHGSGFRFAQVSEEELSFPLAFSLVIYKDLGQVERLLRAVYRPHNIYCFHVDNKSHPLLKTELRLIVDCLPNVYILDRSFDIKWGEMTVLLPDLECMKRLLRHSTKWKYFINLTGQEFPLRTNKELVQILKALRGANDIGGVRTVKHKYRWKKKKIPPPYNVTLTKGDLRGFMSRRFVEYAIHSRVAQELLKWLNGTVIPDESFFSTLNYNPHLGPPGGYLGSLEGEIERLPIRSYVVWAYEKNRICSGKFKRWVCQLATGDLHRLVTTSNIIANKFDYKFEPLAYDCLEKWYFEKVRLENMGLAAPLNLSEIENSDTVKYRYSGPVLIWE